MKKTEQVMDKNIIGAVVILSFIIGSCWAGCCTKGEVCSQRQETDANSVEAILEQLNKKTRELQTYQAQIVYKFSQPLLESKSVRKGVLYYAKYGEKSRLRINFQKLKQDDENEQKYIEHYIFDGIWLTHIDFQIKSVKRYQLAEPNKPMDAFDLASKNLPIIGFAKIEDLKKQFEVQLVEQSQTEPSPFIQLHLKVKPNSIYKDDYISIDFWIDKNLYLPAKVVAISTEEDIYEIQFLNPKVNKKIGKKTFEFKIPEGFSVDIEPLEKKETK